LKSNVFSQIRHPERAAENQLPVARGLTADSFDAI